MKKEGPGQLHAINECFRVYPWKKKALVSYMQLMNASEYIHEKRRPWSVTCNQWILQSISMKKEGPGQLHAINEYFRVYPWKKKVLVSYMQSMNTSEYIHEKRRSWSVCIHLQANTSLFANRLKDLCLFHPSRMWGLSSKYFSCLSM